MTKNHEKHDLIAVLLEDMYKPEWFSNFQTHGTYGLLDFVEDLRCMDVEELRALRRYQEEDLDADLFYEHVWNGETITYKKLV